jgi:hypothetical protein
VTSPNLLPLADGGFMKLVQSRGEIVFKLREVEEHSRFQSPQAIIQIDQQIILLPQMVVDISQDFLHCTPLARFELLHHQCL